MRRVIENHISEMLDILNDEVKSKGLTPLTDEELSRKRFEDKLVLLANLIPKARTPENHPNPFSLLWTRTSDGLHNLSEDECVDLFDQLRFVFEYVFAHLRPHLDEHKTYRERLQQFNRQPQKA